MPIAKQIGDAGEMLIAAELTLAGIPAMKAPDNWPGYDVVAQPPLDWPGYDVVVQSPNRNPAQRVQVKTLTHKDATNYFVLYHQHDVFDWLAVVFLPGVGSPTRRYYLVPRERADATATAGGSPKVANDRYWSQPTFRKLFGEYENNFYLSRTGTNLGDPASRLIAGAPVGDAEIDADADVIS